MQSHSAVYGLHVLVRLKGFQKLTSIDDAKRKFYDKLEIKPLKVTKVPLRSALNMVLAEDTIAKTHVPRFDRSAVDGFAVKGKETEGSTQFEPTIFELTDNDLLETKQTKQVWTGNLLPERADAVIMLENTRRRGDKIEVWTPVTPRENVFKRGEDISKGQIAIRAGTRLKPQHLGLMAALGVTEAKVFERSKIAILATGNELVEIGRTPQKDQIFETNRLVLSAMCIEIGAQPLDLGIAKDDTNEILDKVKTGLEKADLVVTSGGTSVGGLDLVPDAVNKIGRPGVIVHGVAMRPAMPTALAVVDNRPIVILPGNPVAAMIGFEAFAKPLIEIMSGLRKTEERFATEAKMTKTISTTLGRRTFVRVQVFKKNNELLAEPISVRGSSMISTMTRANGYAIVPENREGLEKGEMVTVHLFDNIDVVDGE